MNIQIRDIEDSCVKKIDELAAQKRMSRNAFLKLVITTLAAEKEIQMLENKYESVIDKLLFVINENSEVLQENSIILKEILADEEEKRV